MQQLKFKPLVVKGFLLMLSLSFFSMVAKAGGDVFQIYLNNKLIVKQFVIEPFNLKKLLLENANSNDNIVIHYTHCGTIGKERSVSIKDDKGVTLKEWKFADAKGSNGGMTIPVKDILQLQKKNNTSGLTIFYAAQEMPKGRTLAALNMGVIRATT